MRREMFLGPWMVGLYWGLLLTPGPVAIGKGFSEEEILSVLPAGSVIASVRTRLHEDSGKTAKKKAIMQVRLINQEDVETIVGYYTEPDRGGEEQTPTYYRRAHVALLARKNSAIKILWDSGGWGFEFGMERIENTYTDSQTSLFFAVRDLNGDGRNEIIFCRASFRAEGSRFEIWQYDPQEQKMIQICDLDGCIELVESPTGKWPIIKTTSFHASTIHSASTEYDPELRRYKLRRSGSSESAIER